MQNFKKKSFQQIQGYEDAQILDPKWPICPNENFFRKPVNEPCSFHSCLSTWQKSKWDINLLVKYRRLQNTEISLADSFLRMLMNHNNFHLTQVPDKTNDAIFLNSPKTLFLDHFGPFWSFLPDGDFFPKNPAVICNYKRAPNSMLSFRKKLMIQFQENLRTDGGMDKRTDTPYFIGPFQLRLGVQ